MSKSIVQNLLISGIKSQNNLDFNKKIKKISVITYVFSIKY